jgi:hypothetical protein
LMRNMLVHNQMVRNLLMRNLLMRNLMVQNHGFCCCPDGRGDRTRDGAAGRERNRKSEQCGGNPFDQRHDEPPFEDFYANVMNLKQCDISFDLFLPKIYTLIQNS